MGPLYGALVTGDREGLLEQLHPDAELHQPPEAPDAGSFYGADEVARGTTSFLSAWEEYSFEQREVRPAGDGVLVHMLFTGRGKGSGVEVTMNLFHAWTFRDGMPYQLFVRTSSASALEAAGLQE